MRRSGLFWGSILVVVGALLLLQNLGIIPASISLWGVFWPLLLIGLGLRALWGVFGPRRALASEAVTIPLEGASQALVRIRHGAGRLHLQAGAGSNEIASGTFLGGLDFSSRREGDELKVKMRVPDDGFMWMGPMEPRDWDVRLNESVPLELNLKTGANEAQLDLTDLRVTGLRYETGASSTELTLPARAGHTRVDISAGAASFNIRVPEGVAVRLRSRGGLSSTDVDTQRFPRQGEVYQSLDYETAANRAEISVEIGAGSVRVV
jgi:hypothetical protein